MNAKAVRSSSRPYAQTSRALAAEETGRRIVEAFIGRLMKEWYDEITLDAVASDAGVTVQTIIRRFQGKDGLLAGTVPVLAAQIDAERAMPVGDIEGIVNSLFTDYERTGDTVIRLLALELRHPAIQNVLNIGRAEHRQWVSTVLEEKLSGLEGAARQRVIDALVIAMDVYTWKLLRRDIGRGVAAAKATMKSIIQSILTGSSDTK